MKIHGVLPQRLFSLVKFHMILIRERKPELVLYPWCLLISALTVPAFSTTTRYDLLETACLFLNAYEKLLAKHELPSGITQTIAAGSLSGLYTTHQLGDALNMFMSLISIIRESSTPISGGNLGGDPLEHSFGHARVRSCDVKKMNKMLMTFSSKAEQTSTRPFLELLNMPRGRHAMAIVCDPWSESPDSELTCSPCDLALSLTEEIGFDLTPILEEKPPPSSDDSISPAPAWCCLLPLPAFQAPTQSGSVRGILYSFLVNLRRNAGKLRTGEFYLRINSFWGSSNPLGLSI
jgi:hypothetical protein